MGRLLRTNVHVAIGYVVAGSVLWLVVRRADWHMLVTGVRSVDWSLLGAAIVVRFAALALSALRWQALLVPVRRVPLGSVIAATMVGMAVTTLVSAQAAEVARPLWLSASTGTELGATLATVAVEWCLDLWAVLMLFVPVQGLLARGGVTGWPDMHVATAVLLVAALAALGGLRWLPRGLVAMRSRVAGSRGGAGPLGHRVMAYLEQSTVGLQTLQCPRGLVLVSMYSVLMALLTAVSAWLALKAFGLPVPFVSAFVVLGLITLGGAIPTPAAIGGFHAVCQVGLMAMLGVDAAVTVLPVIGLHAVLYFPPAIVGATCWLWSAASPQTVFA